jgi:hypothetical protein
MSDTRKPEGASIQAQLAKMRENLEISGAAANAVLDTYKKNFMTLTEASRLSRLRKKSVGGASSPIRRLLHLRNSLI